MARILVIDDEEVFLRLIATLLVRGGHKVRAVGNGQEAAAILKTESFDLVITDILMPDSDGLDALMALRGTKKEIPVIAMSGLCNQSQTYIETARKIGASGNLSKPFTGTELLELANAVIAADHMRQIANCVG